MGVRSLTRAFSHGFWSGDGGLAVWGPWLRWRVGVIVVVVGCCGGLFLTTLVVFFFSLITMQTNTAGWTPLQEACYWGQWKIVNVLLNAGANVNHITKKKQNALHVASQGRYGNEGKIVKTLIQAGCKVDQLDEKGRRPLFDARIPLSESLSQSETPF